MSTSQQLLGHRQQSMRGAALANASKAVKRRGNSARQRQASLRQAMSRWDGEGGAGPDGPQEGGKLSMPVPERTAHEDTPVSANPLSPGNPANGGST